jgi:hypothetical protein
LGNFSSKSKPDDLQADSAFRAFICLRETLFAFAFQGERETPRLIKYYPPCPEQCLTFNPRATLTSINQRTGQVNHRTANYLSGQQVSRFNLHLPDDYLMLKVVFQPGAMYQIFEVPLSFFTDQYLDTETVLEAK